MRPVKIVRTALVVAALACGALGGRELPVPLQAAGLVNFVATDDVGPWFKCVGAGCVPAGTDSLAVVPPGTEVKITVGAETNTVHTFTSLVFPEGADQMPYDQPSAFRNASRTVRLDDPGLYVFVCKIHPFMLAATVVDDPATAGLDLGENISLVTGVTVPTSSDLATRFLRAFWLITNPGNYQDHNPLTNPDLRWTINYPAGVPVRIAGGAVVDLKDTLEARYGNDLPIPGPSVPETKGVGEVWVDTQYEMTESKTKPGTVTAVDASSWKVTQKVSLPEINMNNPHNMWTDAAQRLIYQTQWFDTKLTVFDRRTGRLVRNIEVGQSPAHVMTRVDTDQVHVSINGGGEVVELSPGAQGIDRRLATQHEGEGPAHPHAHWMSHDGQTMVTPNANTNDSTRLDLHSGTISAKFPTGWLPIASGMMPDASKYYVSNYLDNTITCISMGVPRCRDGALDAPTKTIGLLLGGTTFGNYDPISGAGFATSGALPIQTPVSPNGKYMVTAATLTGTILVTDTTTDELVKVLPCSAGCHGVNVGAKKGGGYYAYVSSKFSNDLIVVDPDPNGDGKAMDARIAGRIILAVDERHGETDRGDERGERSSEDGDESRGERSDHRVRSDDRVSAYAGMGGQGVLAIPLVYNGWVQQLPESWKRQLTPQQLHPTR